MLIEKLKIKLNCHIHAGKIIEVLHGAGFSRDSYCGHYSDKAFILINRTSREGSFIYIKQGFDVDSSFTNHRIVSLKELIKLINKSK